MQRCPAERSCWEMLEKVESARCPKEFFISILTGGHPMPPSRATRHSDVQEGDGDVAAEAGLDIGAGITRTAGVGCTVGVAMLAYCVGDV